MSDNQKKVNPFELPENQYPVNKLVLFSILMFTIPILLFFAIFFFFRKVIIVKNSDLVLSLAALTAVLSTILIMVMYVLSAYNEPEEQKQKDE